MRRAEPHIVDYSQHNNRYPWMIDGVRADGKRKRYFFKTESAAKAELARIKTKLRREGSDALKLPDWLRVTALQCTEELKPFNKTIRDATDHYLSYLKEAQKSVTTSELCREYLQSRKNAKRSQRHQDDLRSRLGRFCEAFGKEPVRTLEPAAIERWLQSLKVGAVSLNNYRNRVAGMFLYGIKRGYVDRNPLESIEKVKVVGGPPEIFTPQQMRALLDNAAVALAPVLAIGAFAGLRPAELLRLEWADIDLARGYLNVAASKSKTAKRRLITMSENLRAWLAPFAGSTGPVWPDTQSAFYTAIHEASKAAGLPSWPQNGLRHSFASYHLAKHQDAPRLALDMGHVTPKMIFDHYREIVTPEEAEQFWSIFPPAPAGNVVPMAAAG